MYPDSLVVEVTEADILNARFAEYFLPNFDRCGQCPFALAASRAVGIPMEAVGSFLYDVGGGAPVLEAVGPDALHMSGWILAFDRGEVVAPTQVCFQKYVEPEYEA